MSEGTKILGRFDAFTKEECDLLHDALIPEAELDPAEDAELTRIVAIAERLLLELDTALTALTDEESA